MIKLNLSLVWTSQFLQQFNLNVYYKLGREHIIPDTLSRFASGKIPSTNPQHSELDALFIYNITLIKIYLTIMSWILAGYKTDPWWVRLWIQIQANSNLGIDVAILPFMIDFTPLIDANFYLVQYPDSDKRLFLSILFI